MLRMQTNEATDTMNFSLRLGCLLATYVPVVVDPKFTASLRMLVEFKGPLQTLIDFTIVALGKSPARMSTKPLTIAKDQRHQQSPRFSPWSTTSTKPAR